MGNPYALFASPPLDEQESEVVAAIEGLKRDLDYLASPTRRWLGLMRRNTLARNVRGSNSIEGYHVTLDDAVAAVDGDEPVEPKNEAWLALSGYRLAMTFVLQKAVDPNFRHSEATIQALHYMMTSHQLAKNPGGWRSGSIFVRHEESGELVYEGPPVDRVAGLMAALVETLNDPSTGEHSLVKAAMAHLNLVMIHPFADGNGRMARCLQTLVLARSGTTSPHFCSIEEYLGRPRNTAAYYGVLAAVGQGAWHPERDARPWVRFCITAHHIQASTLLRRARQIQRLADELEDLLAKLGLPERCQLALIDAAQGFKVRNASYRAAAAIAEGTAQKDLKALAAAGLLQARGEKRGRHYLAGPAVMAISHRAAEAKSVADPFGEQTRLGPVSSTLLSPK